jgi:endogenous inhibitor of DNA gyrase (YacG/DUF329 family)
MADGPRCVYCRTEPVDDRWRPFCSERCRMADLGRWLREDYHIAGDDMDVDPEFRDGAEAPPPSRRPRP